MYKKAIELVLLLVLVYASVYAENSLKRVKGANAKTSDTNVDVSTTTLSTSSIIERAGIQYNRFWNDVGCIVLKCAGNLDGLMGKNPEAVIIYIKGENVRTEYYSASKTVPSGVKIENSTDTWLMMPSGTDHRPSNKYSNYFASYMFYKDWYQIVKMISKENKLQINETNVEGKKYYVINIGGASLTVEAGSLNLTSMISENASIDLKDFRPIRGSKWLYPYKITTHLEEIASQTDVISIVSDKTIKDSFFRPESVSMIADPKAEAYNKEMQKPEDSPEDIMKKMKKTYERIEENSK